MLQKIQTSRISKIIASYLAVQMVVSVIQPVQLYASTSGPSQPEFNSFTPIDTSDMVNLSTGDFNYNIPIMDVGGYPINLAYDSGIGMDQEASWVGLGWNLNIGQITRNVRGIPDDFSGDEMIYENYIRDNVSVGVNADIRAALFGWDAISLGVGIGVQYNNYNGITFNTSFGPSFDLGDRVSIGMRFGSTSEGGASVSPMVSIKDEEENVEEGTVKSLSSNFGVTYDSRQGLSTFNIGVNKSQESKDKKNKVGSNLGFKLNDYMTFTPKYDLSFANTNLTLSLAGGVEVFGVEGQGQITGWASIQKLSLNDRIKAIPAYGYENLEKNLIGQSILDFNREKEGIVTENTTTLAPVNYTYDSYTINGQGFQGSFRPYRNQVGNVYDNTVSSTGVGVSVGVEIGAGAYAHVGVDVEVNPSNSTSGRWQDQSNPVLPNFELQSEYPTQKADYEPTYYKMNGDLSADLEVENAHFKYHGESALKIGLGGGKHARRTVSNYKAKLYDANYVPYESSSPINRIKRQNRLKRSQAILKVNNEQAAFDGMVENRSGANNFVKNHHTAGYHILKTDGTRYIFGETAYNTHKEETTFAVGNRAADCKTGLVNYDLDADNSIGNRKGKDHFFSNVITPAYAHSYLLTAVLSDDYEDLDNDGPTPDDLGTYTKINYTKYSGDYKWRVPFAHKKASYNAGLFTESEDQKGSYIYGKKELKYVHSIETKTHIAIFHLSTRNDAIGVADKNGGPGSSRLQKLDKIKLYTIPEYKAHGANATPIKTAHFDYNYSLCPEIPNNSIPSNGKLTLNEVYFTYQNSNLGEYTPYIFHYSTHNPDYNLKGYDVWGNYKENIANPSCTVTTGALTTTEFPYVEQNKTVADKSAIAWSLESIDLPSGGKLTIEQESDDYRFVQNRKAMQMFKLAGMGNISGDPNGPAITTNDIGNDLYDSSGSKKYLYIELPDILPDGYNPNNFVDDLIKNNYGGNGDVGTQNNLLYFRVLTNMTKNGIDDYDYVTGYLEIDGQANYFSLDNQHYLSVPLKFLEKEGGIINSGEMVNPISKAGWYFSRKYLNRQAYGLSNSTNIVNEANLVSVGESLIRSIANVTEILGGPNQALKKRKIAKKIIPHKSWVRLYEPFGFKYGGGIRVKSIKLDDEWDVMVGNSVYKNFYGQEYSYTDEDGKSSGVATFEPNGSKENPFVLPVFDKAEKVIAPKESNYTEKPLGESFYPAAQVTYSRVKVKNINKNFDNYTFDKHGTGEVITTFYTSRDFPTTSDFTIPDVYFDPSGILGSILSIRTKNHLAMSQGFVVHTNDMNGKMKSQRVRGHGQEAGEFLSGVDYVYTVDDQGKLDNMIDVVHRDGTVSKELVGVDYDMVNDFRESRSLAEVMGADGNLGIIPLIFFPLTVPTIFPNYMSHENVLKTATTTKTIHTRGILKEKIAYDLGSRVQTKNLAWDADTGNVLLTEVDNEYDDKYYSFTYPANWYYKNMGMAADNLGVEGIVAHYAGGTHRIYHPYSGSLITPASEFLNLGDELFLKETGNRYWVVYINNNDIKLMDRTGQWATVEEGAFKVVRSGKRNNLNANMAGVTTREIPFTTNAIGGLSGLIAPNEWMPKKVLNASAVIYNDLWNGLCETDFPYIGTVTYSPNGNINSIDQDRLYNPYLLNEKGDSRPQKSYAYLTGRNNGSVGYHPRNEGFFTAYTPFYRQHSGSLWNWQINGQGWTYASEVTKFNVYGAEVENRDAFGRKSSALYNYASTLPVAVGTNTGYQELGFDSFEYTDNQELKNQNHFSFREAIEESEMAGITPLESHTGNTSVRIEGGGVLAYTNNPECVEMYVCGDDVDFEGGPGIYVMDVYIGPHTGVYGVKYDALRIPDRFQIFYDGNKVADSKYVGDYLSNSTYVNNFIGTYPNIPRKVYDYNLLEFVPTGTETVTVTGGDIGSPSGMGCISFNKESTVNTMTIVVTGVGQNTAWNILEILCGQGCYNFENTQPRIKKILYIETGNTDDPEGDIIFDETIHQKVKG